MPINTPFNLNRGNSMTASTPLQRLIQQGKEIQENARIWFLEQTLAKKILTVICIVILFIIAFVALVFHKQVIEFLILIADKLEGFKYGKLILFTLIFCVGFPPLLGFLPLSLLCGMAYGFPYGWPLLAVASITGLFASFLVFRYLLHNQANRMVHSHEQFRAFADVLKEDSSLYILILLRLCPLPYSLSNGALAAIPELPAWRYLLASIISSPKMLIHIFVGNKLRDLGQENKTTATKIVDLILLLVAVAASGLTTYVIYNKMQQKIAYYHQEGNSTDYDQLVFGNLDDSSGNVELDSADYDADNFVIGDDDEDRDRIEINNETFDDYDIDDDRSFDVTYEDEQLPSLNSKAKVNTRGYRDT